MGCVEAQEILEPTPEQIAAKRAIVGAIIIGVVAAFFMLVYFEWIHPYPNQYRIVTNGVAYRVQEKNWFYHWHVYEEYSAYHGYQVKRFYYKREAKEYMNDLENEEARRMRGQTPNPDDDWKPAN